MTTEVLRAPDGLELRPFSLADVSERYVGWLNDPVVNEFSRRRDMPPSTADDARAYVSGLGPDEQILAIHVPKFGHVGNVKYGPIEPLSRRADISILVGESAIWGKGVGRRAVSLLAAHLFEDRGLNRLEAGTCNPAFVRMVTAIGWTIEGVMRQRVSLAGILHDLVLLAQLREDGQYTVKKGTKQSGDAWQ